jgi:hypothetical protein
MNTYTILFQDVDGFYNTKQIKTQHRSEAVRLCYDDLNVKQVIFINYGEPTNETN